MTRPCKFGINKTVLIERLDLSFAQLIRLAIENNAPSSKTDNAITIFLGQIDLMKTDDGRNAIFLANGMNQIQDFVCCCRIKAGYWFLSATFLGSAAMQHTGRRKKVDYGNLRAGSTVQALMFKERKRFLGCPVYLTNMGLGLVMILALAIAGAVFRKKVLEFFNLIPGLSLLMPLLICAVLGFLVSSTCISTPSVSLEGKSIWILKSLPLAPRQILLAKLRFHNVLVVPIAMASGLILSLAYGCGPVDTLLVTVFPGLLGLLCGLLGMVCGLQWARLDWLTEAHPCKQSVALAVTMLGVMAWLLAGGLVYGFLLHSILTLTEFLALFTLLTTLCCLVLYRTLVTWGAKKWEAL